MTRMPKIQEAVSKFFGREPSKGMHPDECVALGAAIQGAALVDESQEMILLDVTPHALGIMTFGSYFEELIPQNTTVPTSRTKIFTTSRDNQTAVKILVMQGESEKAEDNEVLGEFILTGLGARRRVKSRSRSRSRSTPTASCPSARRISRRASSSRFKSRRRAASRATRSRT